MTDPSSFTLINSQTGNLAFKFFDFADNSHFNQVQRINYYSIIWIQEGEGSVTADFSDYIFKANTMFAFAPYQPFIFNTPMLIKGIAINFHPDFFCIHKHQQEVACNGVLFNNIYHRPLFLIDDANATTLHMLLQQIKTEIQNPALAQYELLVSYLKIFLITTTRLKTLQQPDSQHVPDSPEPFILQKLKDYIERHYKSKHTAANYADMLNITPKALGKITKTHFNKTLTNIIAERIIIEAKRELYLTNKPVKEIAYQLGYIDESYFSRFFKTKVNISPQTYRDTVGFNRA